VTAQPERKKSIPKWAPWLAVAIPVAAGIIYLLIWYGPDVIARHDIGNITGPLRAFRLQQARDAARGRLLTLGAGLFAAGALIFTARNSLFAQRTAQAVQRTVELTEQGQVTDRYTKAIEQLGSDKLDVCIGGIYALEGVARDSARDRPTVIEVLAAFIREHSHEPQPAPKSDDAPTPERVTRPDVQAAVTVLGRNPRHGRQPLNLHAANLSHANLTDANLARANFIDADFTGANLNGANLNGANLNGADFTGANLNGANLNGANLIAANLTGADLPGGEEEIMWADRLAADPPGAYAPGADFTETNLTRAKFSEADLTRADFTEADLTRAKFNGANLQGANLTGANLSANLTRANLTGADLTGADLRLAILSPDAVVPEGFQRDADSGRLKRADTNPG
jgi:hypothetical protein